MKRLLLVLSVLLILTGCSSKQGEMGQNTKNVDVSETQSEIFYFEGRGEEPFWSFELDKNKFVFSDPSQTKEYKITLLEKNGEDFNFEGENISAGKLKKEECVDGGIGNTHAYTVTFTREKDMSYKGCADKTKLKNNKKVSQSRKKSDAWYFVITEIHKNNKDSEETELQTRRYKVTVGLDFYEYDTIIYTYKLLIVDENILEEYKNTFPMG